MRIGREYLFGVKRNRVGHGVRRIAHHLRSDVRQEISMEYHGPLDVVWGHGIRKVINRLRSSMLRGRKMGERVPIFPKNDSY